MAKNPDTFTISLTEEFYNGKINILVRNPKKQKSNKDLVTDF